MRENFRKFLKEASLAPPNGKLPSGRSEDPSSSPNARKTPPEAQETPSSPFPRFKRASEIRPEQLTIPPLLVKGLLHKKSKLILAGGSKAFKTWLLLDLGISVATGLPWLGLQCNPGKVLYLNFELIDSFFESRVVSICEGKKADLPSNFNYWSLRGVCYDLDILSEVLMSRLESLESLDLVIIDPIYKALGSLDENSAGDIACLMKQIERITEVTQAAIAFGAHFSKFSNSRENLDRISGSGVFARDPDAILTLGKGEDPGHFVVESELRYLPKLDPFPIKWEFPLMVPIAQKPDEDPAVKFTPHQLLELLPEGGLILAAWKTRCLQKYGTVKSFHECKDSLLRDGKIQEIENRIVKNLELK